MMNLMAIIVIYLYFLQLCHKFLIEYKFATALNLVANIMNFKLDKIKIPKQKA